MPYPASQRELDALLDQVPVLTGPRTVEELPGGLTNHNLKVTSDQGAFVVRCSDTDANPLGIDRQAEHENTVAAATAGVGPEVFDFRPDLGMLVIGFIDGRTLSRADMGEPGLVPRIASSCRQLHDGPRFQGVFDMFERQRGYLRTTQESGYPIPEGYLEVAETVAEIRQVLAVRDEGTVPCNNDLLAENFIDDGEKVWLIDYEYAGNNDACFELGNVWAECHLDIGQLEELVTGYYGRPRVSRIARAHLLGVVGKYGWTLWGAIQHSTSPIDFDFWGWAMERYEGAVAELRGPDLGRLIEQAQIED